MAYNRGYFSAGARLLASAPSTSRTDVPASRRALQGPLTDDERVIEGITAYAKRMGWTEGELSRLKTAFNDLRITTGEDYKPDLIRDSWRSIEARSLRGELARDAARGEGPGLVGAGTQTGGHNDCAIFAVATASGRPYGFVAAQVNKMIQDGEWRTASERAAPQNAIEKGGGLKAGEVIMLAEGFGQAKIVKPGEFAQALKAGHPVMVNVVPRKGDIDLGHQIVLAKTFQHKGETWYEVIDSAEGPLKRLYMSHKEVNLIIHENGIVYQPDPGSVIKFLRAQTTSR